MCPSPLQLIWSLYMMMMMMMMRMRMRMVMMIMMKTVERVFLSNCSLVRKGSWVLEKARLI